MNLDERVLEEMTKTENYTNSTSDGFKQQKLDALEELNHDNIRENIYDLFKTVGATCWADKPKVVNAVIEQSADDWSEGLNYAKDIAKWLTLYKELNKGDRLSLSDVVVSGLGSDYIHGVILVDNGLNGITHVSRQSLKHIMDIITYLEDYYGARAFISYTYMHSDCFVYAVTFVIWKSHSEDKKISRDWGNLKPLYHYTDTLR